MTQWYQTLFTNYARTYDQEHFTQGTLQEVEFIEKLIHADRSRTILVIGCGTGRHAIELAKRGYRVTGVDLSPSQLQRAAEKAAAAGVQVDFSVADARHLQFSEEFDVAIMLCEGGFSLMETDEMNFNILTSAVMALKPKGLLIFTSLNALFPLTHSTEQFMADNTVEGKSSQHQFDLMTFRDHSTFECADDDGQVRTMQCNERYYAPSEITWMLKTLQCRNIRIWGCDTGDFQVDRPLTGDHFELLVVAEKGW